MNKNTNDKFNSKDSDVTRTPSDCGFSGLHDNRSVFINYLNFYSGNMADRRPHNLDVFK